MRVLIFPFACLRAENGLLTLVECTHVQHAPRPSISAMPGCLKRLGGDSSPPVGHSSHGRHPCGEAVVECIGCGEKSIAYDCAFLYEVTVAMASRRIFVSGLALFTVALGVVACEPYMSMTDQMAAQTRKAAQLLPERPRYVGMVEIETVVTYLEDLTGKSFADSLRQTESPELRQFFDATGLRPERDFNAVYGSLEGDDLVSVVIFGDVTSDQLDQYVDQAPDDVARVTSYRDVPLYHLTKPSDEDPDSLQTLTLGFVDKGTIAGAMTATQVRGMVDRYFAAEDRGLRTNDEYMALIKRVGRGSASWLVGRDVVESALNDTARAGTSNSRGTAPNVNQAGLQRALSKWSDRVLGVSSVSSLDGRAEQKVNQLKRRLREQAVSLSLTESTMEGEVYLTMRDPASASSVVDVARGAVAVMKLSGDDLDRHQRDMIDEIEIDREGAIVHIRFSLDREKIQDRLRNETRATVHRLDPLIHQLRSTIRRRGGITRGRPS